MNVKSLNLTALIASGMIFLAAFFGSAVNGGLYISVLTAGGVWYILPMAGLAGIVLAAIALAGKMSIKLPAIIIGCLVAVLAVWFAYHGKVGLDHFVVMSNDLSQGFNSSFFTGETPDTSDIPKSSFGIGLYLNLMGAALLLLVGILAKRK